MSDNNLLSSAPRIAFGCQARVGKDTACEYLVNKYGGTVFSFAAPLYEILYFAQDVCGFERAKDRKFLQYIGTEWARAQNPTVWIDIMRKQLEQASGPLFISDIRFANEADMLHKLGFTLVKIERTVDTNHWPARGDQPNHASESGMNGYKWDKVVSNNGTLDQFRVKLEQLVKTDKLERIGHGAP